MPFSSPQDGNVNFNFRYLFSCLNFCDEKLTLLKLIKFGLMSSSLVIDLLFDGLSTSCSHLLYFKIINVF